MGYLLSSVKQTQELFMPDCKEIMENLVNLTNTLDKDDAIHRATFVVYENVAECMKDKFVIYSDFVFDKALQAINKKVDCAIIDDHETQKIPKNKMTQYVKLKIDMKIDGMKNIVLNTDSLEQKLQASNLLSTMSEHMGSSFNKYVERMLPTVVDLMTFKNSKEIRNNVLQIAKHMVINCQTMEQKMFVLNNIMPLITAELTTVIRTKDHLAMGNIVEAIVEMMPSMSQDMVAKLPTMMLAVITSVKNLTKEVQKIYSEEDMDEDAQQQMDEQIEQIQQVLQHIEQMISKSGGSNQFIALKQYFPQEYQFETV